MKRIILLFMAITIATVLAACGGNSKDKDKQDQNDTSEQASKDLEIGEDEKVGQDEVVAQINESEVKGLLYNAVYAQTKVQMHQFGQDISDKDAVKQRALDEIIAQELLKQEAKKQGVDVPVKDAQSELDKLKEENEEQLTAYLNEYQLTEDSFKDQIHFGLILDKYVDEQITIEPVTDKEVKTMYEQLKEQNKDIGKLDELKDKIKDSLERQKKQEKLQAKLEELKENAKIEKLI